MRRFFTGMLVMLLLIAAIATGIFGYLFFNNQNAVNDAKQQKLNAELQVTSLQQTVAELSEDRTFQDEKLGMQATYPFDWTLTLNTDITDVFTAEGDVSGPILGGYSWTFTKGSAKLLVDKILGGVGGRGMYLEPAQYDFQVLESDKGDIVRYSEKDKNSWFYVTKADCADFEEAAGNANAVCVDILFSRTDGNNLPTAVRLSGTTDETIIAEADGIAMSLQK